MSPVRRQMRRRDAMEKPMTVLRMPSMPLAPRLQRIVRLRSRAAGPNMLMSRMGMLLETKRSQYHGSSSHTIRAAMGSVTTPSSSRSSRTKRSFPSDISCSEKRALSETVTSSCRKMFSSTVTKLDAEALNRCEYEKSWSCRTPSQCTSTRASTPLSNRVRSLSLTSASSRFDTSRAPNCSAKSYSSTLRRNPLASSIWSTYETTGASLLSPPKRMPDVASGRMGQRRSCARRETAWRSSGVRRSPAMMTPRWDLERTWTSAARSDLSWTLERSRDSRSTATRENCVNGAEVLLHDCSPSMQLRDHSSSVGASFSRNIKLRCTGPGSPPMTPTAHAYA
mmetsp:Transcript_5985/g.14558  ORF Transcript_5985/g.14558 Transcript_5985/m.14558 type:complete len:338 (-) Transcript_5985:870-1883(-)